MAKRMELIEVGDFVKYKDHLMAVVAIHEEKIEHTLYVEAVKE